MLQTQETFGVLGDPATAMRDPVFYRWHAFLDDVFQEHKNTLPRYPVSQVSKASVHNPPISITVQILLPFSVMCCTCNIGPVILIRVLSFYDVNFISLSFSLLYHEAPIVTLILSLS